MMQRQNGFTMIEIMIAMLLTAILIAGVANLFGSNRRVAIEEIASSTLEGDMRIAMSDMTRTLRNAGYGVPGSDMDSWVSWVAGFTANPSVTQGATATDPDSISIAHCTLSDLTTMSANATAGDVTISVTSATNLNTTRKRLLMLDLDENVHVVSVTGTTLGIDSDVVTAGQQGLSRDYPAGTPICRVDVTTYDVDLTTAALRVDYNDGNGLLVVANEIRNMQIVAVGGGESYAITISGQSSTLDPSTGGYTTRTHATTVNPRN